MMNGPRQSDRSIVPKKAANKEGAAALLAELLEERDLPKGNPRGQTNRRAQNREWLQQALARIRRAAQYACALIPEGGARCGNSARRDLRGGSPATGIPTATTLRSEIPARRDCVSVPFRSTAGDSVLRPSEVAGQGKALTLGEIRRRSSRFVKCSG